VPKQKKTVKETAHKKGHDFEKKVSRWATKYFKADEIYTNILLNGLRVKRPYEIDVYVIKKGFLGGLLGNSINIMIECKNLKSSIKRTHIFKQISTAQDINEAYNNGRESNYFDYLAFVSASKFDIDALHYAQDNDIACFYYDGKKYELKTIPSWIN